jgi:hypothetical protein
VTLVSVVKKARKVFSVMDHGRVRRGLSSYDCKTTTMAGIISPNLCICHSQESLFLYVLTRDPRLRKQAAISTDHPRKNAVDARFPPLDGEHLGASVFPSARESGEVGVSQVVHLSTEGAPDTSIRSEEIGQPSASNVDAE